MSEPTNRPEAARRAPVWKIVLATGLDLVTSFTLGGYVIATLTGDRTPGGFALSGLPALALFLFVGAYFIVGRRYAGGTLWDRFFGIARPQP